MIRKIPASHLTIAARSFPEPSSGFVVLREFGQRGIGESAADERGLDVSGRWRGGAEHELPDRPPACSGRYRGAEHARPLGSPSAIG
jgi:hypothetical protein